MRTKVAEFSLKGLVERDVAALFIEQLSELEDDDVPIVVDLTEADIEDAVVAAMLVDCIRATARRIGKIQVLRSPQLLAHALYRLNASSEDVLLVDPRLEIATSS
jgi:hypothetical protein